MKALNVSDLWPSEVAPISQEEFELLAKRLRSGFIAKMREEKLPLELLDSLNLAYLPLAAWARQQKQAGKPLVLGVNGAQGSGKSTLCEFLTLILHEGFGYRAAGFSIDDIYKTRSERLRLGREVHPLLSTRGAPGTHDVELGLNTVRALVSPAGGRIAIPAFDKSKDDRRPQLDWPIFEGPADVVIFEGWCVGAKPQSEAELEEPVNDLEGNEDKDGIWRLHVNRQLQGDYAELFGQMDRLIMIKAPNMQCVFQWRSLQEEKLAEKTAARGGDHAGSWTQNSSSASSCTMNA